MPSTCHEEPEHTGKSLLVTGELKELKTTL